MRHRKKSEKNSRSRAQRKGLLRSLLRSFIVYERIATTKAKARALRGRTEKLITWAKNDTLPHRRLAYRYLTEHRLVKKLFTEIGPRFKNTNGGYTRLINLRRRKGDGASLALLELTKKMAEWRKESKREKAVKEPAKGEKAPAKKEKPARSFVSGVRKIFKKEKQAL